MTTSEQLLWSCMVCDWTWPRPENAPPPVKCPNCGILRLTNPPVPVTPLEELLEGLGRIGQQ